MAIIIKCVIDIKGFVSLLGFHVYTDNSVSQMSISFGKLLYVKLHFNFAIIITN